MTNRDESYWREQQDRLLASGKKRFSVRDVQEILGYKSPSPAQNALQKIAALSDSRISFEPTSRGSWVITDGE